MSHDILDAAADFLPRHIGPSEADQQHMLAAIAAPSLEALIDDVVPAAIRLDTPLALPGPRSEPDVLAELQQMAATNQIYRSYIGQGYYGTHTPNVIARNILENPAWYTAYTPYQPEISQGRLEALLNFQTMVADLTGLDIANASLLDEATAAAEAMTLARRGSRAKSEVFFVSCHCHPQTIAVVRTRAEALGITIIVADEDAGLPDCFGVLLQYPRTLGALADYRDLTAQAHAQGALVACATDLLALALLVPPGQWGADIAIGSAQRFGVPMGFGGPHAGFMACQDALKRNLPGRLVGVSRDAQGQPALRLALQTREQHIRREKATSNICTAQVLLAVMAGMYALWHGPTGITRIARRVQAYTTWLRDSLALLGITVVNDHFFDTLLIASGARSAALLQAAKTARINLRHVDAEHVAVALDETVTRDDLRDLIGVFAQAWGSPGQLAPLAHDHDTQAGIPAALQRRSAILSHPVFSSIQSETDMLRYLRQLADRDLALDRTMIPLGSCTMKLNATAEMLPITFPGFAQLHPFVPAEQSMGYRDLISKLSAALCEITGYDAISLQPNSGAQGEYAGLLAIRAYHQARGQSQRNVCLIPASAHGTNPASAQLAGMEVVIVASDAQGNVDVADLAARIAEVGERLAALMITYPSTHGVFEAAITQICAMIHDAGGQVYLDGANMNAMVGIAKPGKFGADVSHLNLHKTFCIPHGGGGPGVGPVAVRAHLAAYLPGVVDATGQMPANATGPGPISAAPYGSASILPISYVYIALMGARGLRRASEVAILNANYLAARLREHYPILYAAANGRVAHECILDVRPLKDATGISAEDISKRLMDYGFHAPTMSFPVAGTLMVEPTESESLAELDRFIDAMLAIRAEIAAIETGASDREDNPLKNAPHPAHVLLASTWSHGYSREEAAYPIATLRTTKYWPPVARVDNAHGDRNLVCACPPVADYV